MHEWKDAVMLVKKNVKPWAFHLCLGHSHAQLPNLQQPQDWHYLKEKKSQHSEKCIRFIICL